MSTCLTCGKGVTQSPGKKAKQFCDGNCRNKYYYAQKNIGKPAKKRGRPKSTIGVKKGDVINYTPTPIFTSKENIEKLNEAFHEVGAVAPKNLTDLKALCPADLTGLDRSIWINEQRKKYNI